MQPTQLTFHSQLYIPPFKGGQEGLQGDTRIYHHSYDLVFPHQDAALCIFGGVAGMDADALPEAVKAAITRYQRQLGFILGAVRHSDTIFPFRYSTWLRRVGASARHRVISISILTALCRRERVASIKSIKISYLKLLYIIYYI